jgi:transcriptional regulator with XRE-family HTH domain
MDKKSIGKRIQKYREATGISQEKLAERVELSPIFISTIERGVKVPSLESFVKIANALNISFDLLLSDVISNGYTVKASRFAEQIEGLSQEEQQQVFTVVEAMIKNSKKK